MSGGYRFLELDDFEVTNIEGTSQVFDQLFNFPQTGDRLFLESFGYHSNEEAFIGERADAGRVSELQLVKGDFSGWYGGAKIVVFWSLGRL